MIHVTQGHENGIGLEVFLKAASLSPSSWLEKIILVAHKKTVLNQLKHLPIHFELKKDKINLLNGPIHCLWIPSHHQRSQSSTCMEVALENIMASPKNSILFTLPTTKEDLVLKNRPQKKLLGHTEYLRSLYKNDFLSMFFTSPHTNILLLTDHIPLNLVCKKLTTSYIKNKMTLSLNAIQLIEPHIHNIIFAGINPHAGENGLLGKEDGRIKKSYHSLKFPQFKFSGPYPSDSLLIDPKTKNDLIVYPYHDQALGAFKSLFGVLGSNITLGLPFIRLSVDHGTAFNLYGKNLADPRGAFYCLHKAINYLEQMNGQNNHPQSKSS